jgi:transposase
VVHAAPGFAIGGDIVQVIQQPHFDIKDMAALTARAAAGNQPSSTPTAVGPTPGFPRNDGHIGRSRDLPTDGSPMMNPTRSRRRFTAQQKQEAVELCLSEGLSCQAAAERLGLPGRCLARCVRQARIDQGQPSAGDQGAPTSQERQELARLRKENRELRREKDFFKLAAAHFAKEQLPAKGFA